jgi:hypothetical protein
LQVGVGFAERYCPFARVPESCRADEDPGEDSLIEGHQFDSSERQFGGAGEHEVVEAKDLNAWKCGKRFQTVVKRVEVAFDAVLVTVHQGPGDGCVLLRDVAARLGPFEEASNCIGFITRLAFCKDRFSRFADTDVRQVEGEFATARAFQEFGGRWDLMMRWCGVAE